MTNNEFKTLYDLALGLATTAHTNQTDKAGKPYLLHPVQVSEYCESNEAKIVALLHDVLEDNKNFTPNILIGAGIPKGLVMYIQQLTRFKHEDYSGYIFRIEHCHPVVIEVKLADMRHNMEVHRLPEFTLKDVERLIKYHKYYTKLLKIQNEQRK